VVIALWSSGSSRSWLTTGRISIGLRLSLVIADCYGLYSGKYNKERRIKK